MKIKAVLTIIGLSGSLSVMAKMDTIPVSRNYKTILVLLDELHRQQALA